MIKELTEKEAIALCEHTIKQNPPRALLWAWYLMPKNFMTSTGEWRRADFSDQVQFLKKHKKEYYAFLAAHNLTKTVHDRFIGTPDKEVRSVW